jgi:hypothetical protein
MKYFLLLLKSLVVLISSVFLFLLSLDGWLHLHLTVLCGVSVCCVLCFCISHWLFHSLLMLLCSLTHARYESDHDDLTMGIGRSFSTLCFGICYCLSFPSPVLCGSLAFWMDLGKHMHGLNWLGTHRHAWTRQGIMRLEVRLEGWRGAALGGYGVEHDLVLAPLAVEGGMGGGIGG